MNSVGRILLIGGAIVLALLVGVVIGRSHRAESVGDQTATGMQISTEAPPAPPPTPVTKLPTVPEPPPPPAAPVVKVDPKVQVQDDAAAVGMTTRHFDTRDAGAPAAEPNSDPSLAAPEAPAAPDAPPPNP
jgi:hypothetical protein